MTVQALNITKNWNTGTTCVEDNWDNIKDPLTTWAQNMVNDLNQLRIDTQGSTYSLDNDGLANLATPIRQWDTGVSALGWTFTGTVQLSGATNFTGTVSVFADFALSDSADDHYYVFTRAADLAANRAVNFPLLTGDDTFVFEDFIQTLTNKTLTTPDINGGTWYGTIDGNWTAAGEVCADLGTVTTATSITTDALVATTADINGGTIDGTVIGGTTPAAATFSAVYAVPQICQKTYVLPEYIQDEIDRVPMLYVDVTWAPYGIRITKVGMALNENAAYPIMLEKWTSANPPAHSENILTGNLDPGAAAAVASTVNTFTATTTYYDVAVGSIINLDLPTTLNIETLTVWFVYELLGS